MKKSIAITTAAILFVCLSTVSATAGAARRHTLEGFAIGTGIALLGAAIYNDIHRNDQPQYTPRHSRHDKSRHYRDRYASKKRYHRDSKHSQFKHSRLNRKQFNRGPKGHWEVEKRWVAPVYKKRWNPGHYNRRGVWISGGYQRFLVKEGYYTKEKVWTRH